MPDEDRESVAAEPGGFALRHAEAGDVAGIERIERASFSDPWSQDDFISVMSAPQTIFLVAADQRGGIGGYVLVMVIIDESEILNIAVDPAVRGASLGGRLLDAGMTEAGNRGAKEIFLEVRESNEAALRLYSSRGFEAVSRRRKYYRTPVEDALVLRRAMQ